MPNDAAFRGSQNAKGKDPPPAPPSMEGSSNQDHGSNLTTRKFTTHPSLLFDTHSDILAFILPICLILVYNCLRGTILVIEAYRKREFPSDHSDSSRGAICANALSLK